MSVVRFEPDVLIVLIAGPQQQRRPVVSRTPRHPASSPLPSSPLPSLDVVDRVYSQAFVVAESTSIVLTIIPISALSVDFSCVSLVPLALGVICFRLVALACTCFRLALTCACTVSALTQTNGSPARLL